MAKEQEKGRDEAAHPGEMHAADDLTAQMPAGFAEMIQHAEPETIAGWLQAHPALRDPILSSVQEVRGNAFAQTVLAIGPGGGDAAKHEEMQKVAGWNQVSRGSIDARYAPSTVRLPPEVVKDLERLWQKSIAGKEKNWEHGGNVVRRYSGREHIREQPATGPDEFEGDDNEHGLGDTVVATVHTHPEPNVPEHYSCFSAPDLQNYMEPGTGQKPMKILRSGSMTYMLAHTTQSRARVNALFDKHNRPDAEKKFAMMSDIQTVYDAAFDATPGAWDGSDPQHPKARAGSRWAEAGEAAVAAVCAKYELAFYKGEGSDLQRVV